METFLLNYVENQFWKELQNYCKHMRLERYLSFDILFFKDLVWVNSRVYSVFLKCLETLLKHKSRVYEIISQLFIVESEPLMDHSPITQTLNFENNFSIVRKSFLNLVKLGSLVVEYCKMSKI